MNEFFSVIGIIACGVSVIAAIAYVVWLDEQVKEAKRQFDLINRRLDTAANNRLELRQGLARTDDQVKNIWEQIAELRMKEST